MNIRDTVELGIAIILLPLAIRATVHQQNYYYVNHDDTTHNWEPWMSDYVDKWTEFDIRLENVYIEVLPIPLSTF